MANIAIIPARGGSKRIPRKNIKEFLGKPIIAYSIETALKSGLFEEVMVSTEDEEIAEIAKKFGAKVPFMRSGKNADDHATTRDVLLEVVNKYKELGREFDYICCIYATAPLIRQSRLREAYTLISETDADIVLPIVKFSFPIQRAFRCAGSRVYFVEPQYENTRSQDLEPRYHDSGSFYWHKKHVFQSEREFIRCGVELTDLEVQDIDNMDDWKLAELKYQLIMNKGD